MKTRSKSMKGALPPLSTLHGAQMDIVQETSPTYKLENPAFNGPIEPNSDFISALPAEILDNILSYCVLDHEPELAIRLMQPGYKYRSHVLVSLAAMSKLFRDLVESYSLRQLCFAKDRTGFWTHAPREEARLKAQQRSSPRLAEKVREDCSVYRTTFVWELKRRCGVCLDDVWLADQSPMFSHVTCHKSCSITAFGPTITLTTALKQYDLRDYMLIPTREPGPRAKHTDLPKIHYAAVKTGAGWLSGQCMSFRFFEKDVKMIAALVHVDVEANRKQKLEQRLKRKAKKVRKNLRRLKISYYADLLDFQHFEGEEDDATADKLKYYQSLDEDGEYDSDGVSDVEYDSEFGEAATHVELCREVDCWRCEDQKEWAREHKSGMPCWCGWC